MAVSAVSGNAMKTGAGDKPCRYSGIFAGALSIAGKPETVETAVTVPTAGQVLEGKMTCPFKQPVPVREKGQS